MKKIFGFLARPLVWSTLGLAVLLFALWVICDLLHLENQAWLVELLVGAPLTTFLVVYWVRRFLVDRRLTRDLATQARKQATLAGPDALRDFAALEEEFQGAFRELNEACRKRGLLGGAAALPWILVMGPPAVGKTTALDRSGLRFTGMGRRLQGIGPTRNCTWWLASDAVFLDTAGRYAVRDEDQQEWAAFLRLLQRRRRQCIDAVVLQVGLDELLERSPADIERSAIRLRERLDELTQVLGIQIPIHLLFNKTDLLDGFAEFFADLEESERDRAWGFSLDIAAQPALGERTIGPLFDQRMTELVATLNARMNGRLLVQPSRAAQEAALGFPAEVEALRAPLRRFVEVLVDVQAGSEPPRLAAVYLASAVQTGEHRPGGRHRLAAELGLTTAARSPTFAGAAPGHAAEHSSFLRGVFAQVIRHAEDAARPSAQRIRRLQYEQRAAVGLCMAASLAACWVLSHRYQTDQRWLTEVERAVKELRDYDGAAKHASQAEVSQLQTELAHQQTLLNLLDDAPHGALGRPHHKASEILRQRIDTTWLAPLRTRLKSELVHSAQATPNQPSAFNDSFQLLKAGYILDGEECDRIHVTAEDTRDAITDYLVGDWKSALGPNGALLNPRKETEPQRPVFLNGQLQRSLQFFFDQDRQEYKKNSLHLDKGLRDKTRENLRHAEPDDAGLIFQLRASNANLYTKVPQARLTAIVDPGIEPVFTKSGCSQFFDKKTANGKYWWKCVLDVEEPKETINLEQVYREHYLEAWKSWLQGLELTATKDEKGDPLAQPANTLDALVRSARPELNEIIQLVGRGREESIVPKSIRRARPVGCSGWLRKNAIKAGKEIKGFNQPEECTQAQSAFIPFVLLTEKPAKEKDPGDDDDTVQNIPTESYPNYLDAAKKLNAKVHSIHTMAVNMRPAASLKLVQDTMQSTGELGAVDQARRSLLNDLDVRMASTKISVTDSGLNQKILYRVEQDIWHALLPAAAKAIDEKWRTEVYNPYTQAMAKHKRYNAMDPEVVTTKVEFLKTVKDFSQKVLAPMYQSSDPSRCSLTTVPEPFGEQPGLSRSACEKVQKYIRVAEVTDPTKALGSGGSAPKRPPLSADVPNLGGCHGFNAHEVRLDDGANVHTCGQQTGICRHEPSSEKRPSLWVSWGEENSFKRYLDGQDYAVFLKDHGTVEGNHLYFTIPMKSAPNQCGNIRIKFELEPGAGGGGGAPAKPDNAWRDIDLPNSLLGH